MLGIIIGISSVITISALGETSRALMAKEFQRFGNQRAYIYVGYSEEFQESDNFTDDDVAKVKKAFKDQVQHISFPAGSSGTAKYKKNNGKVSISGVDENYMLIDKTLNLVKGRFINTQDVKSRAPVAIIDEKLAMKLFGRSDVLGQQFYVDTGSEMKPFTIVGLHSPKPSLFDNLFGGGRDQTTMYSVNKYIDPYSTSYYAFELLVREGYDSPTVAKQVTSFLEKIKGKQPGFYQVETVEKQRAMVDGFLGNVSLVIGAIAAISLLVGGIGVMNIMLVSVTERTKEIGIRKSLGATRRDILGQFLIESMIISGVGGVIGTSLGIGVTAIVAAFFKQAPVISGGTIVVAVIFSAGVGVFFGMYPANRAAKLDPIEALRYE